ncbi:BatA domain-containing protein [Rubrolithibacter danxiaensis]|uniref:BatA domain-containing protein n=1 Tax=Rubrolithibacter danxiaensis TaxID=3390805 RepID=UPI003BF7906A
MNFLFPGFLFALSALAIPVIIHLFNFRKYKKIYFSNVSFLKEVEQKSSSKRQLKNLLVLAARMLAILFLVLAFAQPYIPSADSETASGPHFVSVYIDNSYSMEAVNKEGSLLDEAKRRAKEIVAAYSLNDKFQLLTNDFEGKYQRFLSATDFLNAVEEVQLSSTGRTLKEVITRQGNLFPDQVNRGAAYLISDFQQNMLVSAALPNQEVPVRLIRVKANKQANISIDSVWFASPIHRPGETEKLVVQLRNNSDQLAANVPVKLSVNNRQLAFGSINVSGRKKAEITLSFSGLSGGWQKGQIHITDNPLTFDDDFYFTFFVQQSLPVLAINDSLPSPYLQAVYQADPFFNLINLQAGAIKYSELNTYPLIILNGLNTVSTGLAQQLRIYVENGGSLVVFPSLTADLSSYRRFLQALGTDVPEEVITAANKVTEINLGHPVFNDVFENHSANPDLPAVKKYIRYSIKSRTGKQNLLSLPGRRSFASAYKVKKGKVYLFAVPLDPEASNLVNHAVFVPLMYQTALLSLRDNRLFYTVGKDDLLELNRINLAPNQTLSLRKDKFQTIPDLRQGENLTRLFVADQVRKKGNYELFKGDSLIGMFAFNINSSESDLTYADDSELKQALSDQQVQIISPGPESVQNAVKAAGSGIPLWKVCLILSLIFIAAEILLIRFLKTSQNFTFNETSTS